MAGWFNKHTPPFGPKYMANHGKQSHEHEPALVSAAPGVSQILPFALIVSRTYRPERIPNQPHSHAKQNEVLNERFKSVLHGWPALFSLKDRFWRLNDAQALHGDGQA